MYKKKLNAVEFIELVINKELEIAGAPIRYKDIMSVPLEKRNELTFYDDYSFKTLNEFLEWRQFFYDHFYDWQPKSVSKKAMEQEFGWWNLNWGLRCDFPDEEILNYDKKK